LRYRLYFATFFVKRKTLVEGILTYCWKPRVTVIHPTVPRDGTLPLLSAKPQSPHSASAKLYCLVTGACLNAQRIIQQHCTVDCRSNSFVCRNNARNSLPDVKCVTVGTSKRILSSIDLSRTDVDRPC